MATFSSLQQQHVLAALAEHARLGADDFASTYGFGAPSGYAVVHEGERYDAVAVLGVAHRYATGRLATPEEVTNGLPTALAILRRRGFEVAEPALAARPAAAVTRSAPARRTAGTRTPGTRTSGTRTAAPSPARRAATERVAAICPTCAMTLPATGICDDCG
ncbi:hypothetical protein [Cellulomonas marina]|uniref:ScoMcrA-like N-terminal head domain-containing protein n=1 Tax=Cellulomonas marina TaxID=988821 RepID=A0A1I1A2S8_9CELL|nr:hypothetical protein [Cellulomonas marina]GIG29466.1 hypothetical protein Cma02nite_20660 [Cellulomonas marina]SFB30703.1 hypothetical protein SAMN05421867_113107 [Cellulomonas marina]